MADKIGEGYIDVDLRVDEKSAKATEKRLQKSLDTQVQANLKAQQSLSKQKAKAESDALDHSIKLIEAQEKRQAIAARQERKDLDEKAKRLREIEREVFAAGKAEADIKRRAEAEAQKYAKNEMVRIKRIEKEALISTKKVERERERIISRSSRRRGSNNRGVGILGVIGDTSQNLLSVLPGQIEKIFKNPALAAGAAAVGVEVAGMFGAGLVAGIGALELGGGIALAISADPKLQEAGKALGTKIFSGLQQSALDTLGPEIQKSFDFLEQSGFANKISAKFKFVFSNLGPTLLPLTKDVSEGIDTILDSLVRLSMTAGPYIDGIGKGFKQISRSVADLFDDLGANSSGLKLLLGDIFGLVSGTIKAIDKIIVFSAEARLAVQGIFTGKDARNDLEKLGGEDAIPGLRKTYQEYIDRGKEIVKSANGNAEAIAAGNQLIATGQDSLNHVNEVATGVENQKRAALDKATHSSEAAAMATDLLTQATKEAIAAQRAYDDLIKRGIDYELDHKDAIDATKEAFSKYRGVTNLNDKETRARRRLISDEIFAIKEEAVKRRESGQTIQQVSKFYRDQAGEILKATGAKGKERDAIQQIIDKYGTFNKTEVKPKEIKTQLDAASYNYVAAALGILTRDATKNVYVNLKSKTPYGGAGAGSGGTNDASAVKKASGGFIKGPGTGTSDSIPANLSDGEFVIKASSVKKIGVNRLNQLNRQGFASGGYAGQGRGKTAGEVAAYNRLIQQISQLTKVITAQSAALTKYTDQIASISSALDQNASLGSADTSSGTAFLTSLKGKRAQNNDFLKNITALKKRGLGQQGLEQLAAAGPDSPLGKLLGSQLSDSDLKRINALLGGDQATGLAVANVLNPGGADLKKKKAANEALLKKKAAAAAKLKAPRGTGATIKYVNGKPQAFFSSKELQNQQLKTDTYVTVMIDGKEVRAIVKQEQAKSTKKTNSKLKSGKR